MSALSDSTSLHSISGTFSNLASKPPPCPSQCLLNGDSLAQVPMALHSPLTSHVNLCLWSLGFDDPPCPLPQLLLSVTSGSLLTPMLCLLLHLLKTPQASPGTLRIFALTLNIHTPLKSTKTPGPDPDALVGGRVGGRRTKGHAVQNRRSQESPGYLVVPIWEIRSE